MAGTAGGLTQFQLVEDSAPATQTQKAITDAITKSTLSMIGCAPTSPHGLVACIQCDAWQ